MFSIGKLDIWVRATVLIGKGGLCVPYYPQSMSRKQRFWFVLGGPAASLIQALTLIAVFYVCQPKGVAGAAFFLFLIYSSLVFFGSIIPSEKGIVTASGKITYNDGHKLRAIIKEKKMPTSYIEAAKLYEKKDYKGAAPLLDALLAAGTKDPDVYRLAIGTHIQLKNYNYANQIQKEQIQKIGNLNANDRVNLALLKTFLCSHDEAIAYYKHLLQKQEINVYNLNNLGYTYTLTGEHEKAIPCLDAAIKLDGNFAYAYSNRAYAKMKMGHWEDGKSDNDISLSLDPESPETYRNAGLYHFEMAQYEEALAAFEKVRDIDPSFDSINRYISDTEWHVSQKNLPEEEG